jgi:hypothetical protein
MVGRTRRIRPRAPRASGTPPRHVVQFFVSAGNENFPARKLGTRAAKRLLKSKEVRVFLQALDDSLGVGMSKAKVLRDPNCVTRREFLLSYHCTPPSDRFVSRMATPETLESQGNPFRKRGLGQAARRLASGSIHSGGWRANAQRDESHQSAYGERGTGLDAGQTDIGRAFKLLNRAGAGTWMGDGGMHGELRTAVTSQAIPANPKTCRPEGRTR